MAPTPTDLRSAVDDHAEAEIDHEFTARGRALGYDVQSIDQLDRSYYTETGGDGAGVPEREAPADPSPFSRFQGRDAGKVERARALGQQRQPHDDDHDDDRIARAAEVRYDPAAVARSGRPIQLQRTEQDDREAARAQPERAQPERQPASQYRRPQPVAPRYPSISKQPAEDTSKPKRKQIIVSYDEEPIDLIDQRTGETVTVYMRSVPTTELPYLDRHDMMLQRLRQRMANIPGKDRKEQSMIERMVAEYNAIAEEMTRFVIEMPDGLFQTLNVPTLRALQREISAMVNGSAVDSDGDGYDGPNY